MACGEAKSGGDEGLTPTEVEEPITASLLEATSVNCQRLAAKLRKNQTAVHSYLGNTLPTLPKDDKSKYLALYSDYIFLQSGKQSIEDYNKRLLTYNAQKDDYTDRLVREIGALKSTATDQNTRSGSSKMISIPQDKYVKMHEEMQGRARETALLKKQVERMKVEAQEETELLKMQLRAHRDDWEAERREKVEVENRELQLQETVHRMERKVRELQQQLFENESCKCQCHGSNYGSQSEPIIKNHLSSVSSNSYYGSSARLIPRSQFSTSVSSESEVVADGAAHNSSPSLATSSIRTEKNDDIHCPDCGKVFPKHVHLHFLEHFERCHRRTLL